MRCWASLLVAGFVIVIFAFMVQQGFAVTSQEASDETLNADQALRTAFIGVVDAEHSGANVSVLLVRLNEAALNLSRAQEAISVGNYSDAVEFAGNCKVLADGIKGDAFVLKSDVVTAAGKWWMTVLFSVAGSIAFGAVLFLVWRWFRHRYMKSTRAKFPEVTS